ncbi:TVP38/TMEM64 family protein [Halomonas salifodinae]|uniref:TVP38/TMEM64 family membrane protein n=2 Tax=Halomonas salifodinae TaxID=438745 RepID=A0ABW2EXG8_9GAMM
MGWQFRLGAILLIVATLAGIWWLLDGMGMPTSLSPRAIAEWLNGQGMEGPLLLVLLMILAVVVGPIPTLPISAAAGLAFGVGSGVMLSITGATLGALIAFFLARLIGREALRSRLPDNPLFGSRGSQRLLFCTVLITRLVPIFSFALISYAAGLTAISAWRFALASLIGMLPMTVVFTNLGHSFELHPWLSTTLGGAILLVMALLPGYLKYRPHSRLARWLHLDSRD